MKTLSAAIAVLLCLVCATFALNATVYYDAVKGFYVVPNSLDLKNGAAVAIYNPTFFVKGFDTLHVTTNSKFDDAVQAYAAGFVEGVVTADRIWTHWSNMNTYTWAKTGGKMPGFVRQFLSEQLMWMQQQVKLNAKDPYWAQVNTVLQQYIGLVAGYNSVASAKNQTIDEVDMHTVTSFGDLFEITATNAAYAPKFNSMTASDLMTYFEENTHCSALIKVTPDLSDMFFAHTSWFTFASMTRIHKEYKFNFNSPLVQAKQVVFSSYPGVLASNDDYYITSQKLVVIETSIVVLNSSLFQLIKPQSLLCWQRVILANRLASTSPQWASIFSLYNSGTYNNQFMALDLKQLVPNEQVKENTLVIAEQMPGKIAINDVSNVLAFGYWPSYNVPYDRSIQEYSGLLDSLQKHPETAVMMSYQHCVRANIFRRDQTKVDSLEGMKKMIRYNDYQHDPLSLGNPGYAIASRNDLRENKKSCGGAYDAKVSSYSLIMKNPSDLPMQIINGPTYDQQPAFQFDDQCGPYVSHLGMPQSYKFPWQSFTTADFE